MKASRNRRAFTREYSVCRAPQLEELDILNHDLDETSGIKTRQQFHG